MPKAPPRVDSQLFIIESRPSALQLFILALIFVRLEAGTTVPLESQTTTKSVQQILSYQAHRIVLSIYLNADLYPLKTSEGTKQNIYCLFKDLHIGCSRCSAYFRIHIIRLNIDHASLQDKEHFHLWQHFTSHQHSINLRTKRFHN